MKLAREGCARYLRVASLRSLNANWHFSFYQGGEGGRLRKAQLLRRRNSGGKKEYK